MSNKENTITITGNLGRDAELRYTKTGKPVTSFSMGHTPRFKSGDEWVDGETIWFKVTVWDSLPELLFTKGVAVIVSGELRQESWENDNKETRTGLVINASSVGLLHRTSTPSDAKIASWPVTEPVPPMTTTDETPF